MPTLTGNVAAPTLSGNLTYQGARGYSAYEIAVQEGYSGTQAEWIESLNENFSSMTATATTLSEGASATASVTMGGTHGARTAAFELGIPVGATGAAAGFGTPTATATGLDPDDDPTVSVTASGQDTSKIFSFAFGIPQGETGNGIASITLVSGSHLPGTYDTYRVTYTDGTYYEYQVWNGENGTGSGDMMKAVYDVNNTGVVDNSERLQGYAASYFQQALESGTNIKTIGGQSVLGSGNIPMPSVDQTYDGTSVNAQSGTAVAGAISTKQNTLTAGTGISIVDDVISNTQTSAEWGNITGTLSDQTDLNTALGGKQATLVSGTNIKTINSNSILGSGNVDITSVYFKDTASGSAESINADTLGTKSLTTLLGMIYPIGSIYTTTSASTPEQILGFGTWTLVASKMPIGENVFGNGKSFGLTDGYGNFDSIYASGTNYLYNAKDVFGKTLPDSSHASAVYIGNNNTLGVPTKAQLGANPEYSGLVMDTINVNMYRRDA